jgi:hypothetical protein
MHIRDSYSTDPADRAAFIAGLRELADYLTTHPHIPVPRNRREILLHVRGDDQRQREEIQRVAELLNITPRFGAHYTATRAFGPIGYQFVAIPAAWKTEHDARHSYVNNIHTAA